jgi:hypothetical protein
MVLVLMVLEYVLTMMEDEWMLKIIKYEFILRKYKRTLPFVDRLLITVACDTSD